MQKQQNIWVNLLVLFCTFAVFILTVEIGARVYLHGWSSLRPSLSRSIPFVGARPGVYQKSTIGLGRELIPNQYTRFKKVIHQTNSQGLRDREYVLEKPANTFRVAVLGDSFTMPAGVAIEDAYHTLLEERFNAESETLQYEFINFGVGGYSLKDYLLQLQLKVPEYEPDLLLIGFMPFNDVQEYFPSIKGKIIPRSNYWAYLLAVVKYGKDAIHPLIKSAWNTANVSIVSPSKKNKVILENEAYLRRIFAEIAAESTEKDIPVVVANLEFVPVNTLLLSLLEEITAGHGMSFVDTSVHFKGIDPHSLILYRADRHANAKANTIFADVIYEHLKKEQLLPVSK
jgi:hypothetical protein